jgi:hypothetical protein
MKVWLVGVSGYDEHSADYVCLSRESALKRWDEVRDNLIKRFADLVIFCKEKGYDYGSVWEEHIKSLQNLKPGEWCNCDSPFITEMETEE